jgi:hypothetical protein
MKKAFLAVAMLVSAAALLLAVSCRDDSGVSGKNEHGTEQNIAPVTTGEVEILCSYDPNWPHPKGTFVFPDEDSLNAFLGSFTPLRTIKEMAHKPDFKQWTYFAFARSADFDMVGVSYGDDAVTVNYYNYSYDCDEPCLIAPAPYPPVINVYFIPFTDKAVKFEEVEPPTNDK